MAPKQRWMPIGVYRNGSLPYRPPPPPIKHITTVLDMIEKRKENKRLEQEQAKNASDACYNPKN